MSSTSDRRLGAILGSLVADAATMPLHWIYDADQLSSTVGGKQPIFFDPPSCPFYSYEPGRNSPYGEQVLHLLEHLSTFSSVDGGALAKATHEHFKTDGPFTGRRNHSLVDFLSNFEAGKEYPHVGSDDTQADGLTKASLVASLYAGKPEMLDKVEEAVRVTQNTSKAVNMARVGAAITEGVILGRSLEESIDHALSNLDDILIEKDPSLVEQLTSIRSRRTDDHTSVVADVGKSCAYPYSLVNGVHLLLQEADFSAGLSKTILAGGDNASRAGFIGGAYGASIGASGIPDEWKAKYGAYESALEYAKKVVGE